MGMDVLAVGLVLSQYRRIARTVTLFANWHPAGLDFGGLVPATPRALFERERERFYKSQSRELLE